MAWHYTVLTTRSLKIRSTRDRPQFREMLLRSMLRSMLRNKAGSESEAFRPFAFIFPKYTERG